METFLIILNWYNTATSANDKRAYNACPICGSTWWNRDNGLFNVEWHEKDCFIPAVQDQCNKKAV